MGWSNEGAPLYPEPALVRPRYMSVPASAPAGSPPQVSHWQEGLHVWVPPIPQAWVAPGMQAPSFMQAPHGDQAPLLHVRDCVPQFPQAWVMGPVQVCPAHAAHWQADVQVCIPPVPHAWLAPGAHIPSFMQAPQSDQVPLLHVRDCVPQFPHAWVMGPVQVWPPHVPHWQAGEQVCIPPVPHFFIDPGAHIPSFMHVDHLDQTPLLHARVWVPQFPQAWVAGPTQVWPVHWPHWQALVQAWVPFMPQVCVEPGWQPMAVQVPTEPATVQLSQLPPQARSQQTPPAQESPLWQSLLSRQVCPFAACPHLPDMHLVGAWHIVDGPSPTQAPLQLAPSAAQV
jgi:hypothetical protein